MIEKLTKTKAKSLVSKLGILDSACSAMFLKNDIISLFIDDNDIGTNLKMNGTTVVKSFLGVVLEDGLIFKSVDDFENILGRLRQGLDTKGVQCGISYDEHHIGIVINDELITLFTTIPYVVDKLSLLYTNHTFESYREYIISDLTMTQMSRIDLNKLKNSQVVKVDTDSGRVRISKNILSLMGTVRTDSDPTFSTGYGVKILNDGKFVLVLDTKYKEMEAVHIYAVEPY